MKFKNVRYYIDFKVNYEKWVSYFLQVNKPNLLQSWAYGNAKSQSQRWNVKRGIIYADNKPIAIIQVLIKSFLFFKGVRINQGPLWLIDNPSAEQVTDVLRCLKKYWNIKNFCILFMAPNLVNTSHTQAALRKLRFYKSGSFKLNSGLVDLSKNEDELRADLRGNWRRQLKAAEKKEVSFVVSNKVEDFQWLMSQYAEYQEKKLFQGTPISLLEALYKNTIDFHEVWMGFAIYNDERIAGMLVGYYGKSCTPLVSWLHEKGRGLNAGNFILWQMVLFSKNKGCSLFEQGGIDDNNADVARFKRGIPCDEYELIGEYVAVI